MPCVTSWSSRASTPSRQPRGDPASPSDSLSISSAGLPRGFSRHAFHAPTSNVPSFREVMGRSELTIYIVEDSPAVMERLVEAIDDVPNARVVGRADAVHTALEGMRAACPRVLILDVQLRGGSGFRLLKLMRSEGLSRPEAVIVVTNYPTDDYRNASRECGADHFFDKAAEFHKVREVLMRLGQ